jgi:hypothetical protein
MPRSENGGSGTAWSAEGRSRGRRIRPGRIGGGTFRSDNGAKKLDGEPVQRRLPECGDASLGGQLMGIAKYEIFGKEGAWRIRHDGKAKNEYATKEAAFEAALRRLQSRCVTSH